MPDVAGSRISPIAPPSATREKSSPRLLVVQEEGRALGVEEPRCLRHDPVEDGVEPEFRGDVRDEVDEIQLPLAPLLHLLDLEQPPQRGGRLRAYVGEDAEVLLGEAAVALVEALRHAEDGASGQADGHGEDGARPIAAALVRRAVEALVGIGIVDDRACAALKDAAGDAVGVEDAHLAPQQTLRDDRVELARGRIVKVEGRPVAADAFCRDLGDDFQDFLQRVERADLFPGAQQHLRAAQMLLQLG